MIEIEIDNEKLELPENTSAVFNFSFFDVEDFLRVGASYTYTINVPATEKNDRIFNFARRMDVFSELLRKTAIVRIFGIEIDNSAVVRVASYDKKSYNINLLLNVSDLSSQISNKTLQDLTTLGSVMYNFANQNYTNHSANFVNFVGGRVFEGVNAFYTMGRNFEVWWRNFFSAKMLYLFEKIFQETTYTLDTNYPASFTALEDLYLHTTIEKTNVEKQHELTRNDRFTEISPISDITLTAPTNILISSNFFATGKGQSYTTAGSVPIPLRYFTDPNLSYSIDLDIQIQIFGQRTFTFEVGYATNLSDIPNSFVVLRSFQFVNDDFVFQKKVGFTFSGNVPNNQIFFRFSWTPTSSPIAVKILKETKITIEPTNYIPENFYFWDYAKNLPPVSQKDLIKTLLLFSGCVLSVDAFLKQIKIVAIKDIINQQAIDITEYIDFSEEGAIDFVPSKLAQKNRYKFQNSESGSYTFVINNNELAESRDITIPFAIYPNEVFYERFALVATRKITAKRAYNTNAENFDSGVRTHTQRHGVETETEYKEVTPFFGRNNKDMYHPDWGANLYSIYRTPLNTPNASTFTDFDFSTFANTDLRGMQCLQNIQNVLNLDYVDDIYKNFRKVRFKAVLPITFLLNASISKPVFVGGNINQKFLLSEIRNWTSPHNLCEIELIRININ